MFDLNALYQPRNAESRSISAENPTGEKGGGGHADLDSSLTPLASAARELGKGWKVSPCRKIAAGEEAVLMDVAGPGMIRHIWMTTHPQNMRSFILRAYWDGSEQPAIEVPLGDFFCQGWGRAQDIFAGPINVNPQQSLNCFFPMPFRKAARITVENRMDEDEDLFFYTIDYSLEEVSEDALYLHAQFRQARPQTYGEAYTLLDGVKGRGQVVGTFMTWHQKRDGWWGEGEVKFYLDGDTDYPTICGTGTEDYFGGAWNFGGRNYSAPCFGYQHMGSSAAYTETPVEGAETAGSKLTMYRFHLMDPIYFQRDLRMTVQALGWQSEKRYRPLEDDLSSVVYWYQNAPAAPFPTLPDC